MPMRSSIQLAALDNELRASSPPFDGLTDLMAWLDLNAASLNGNPSAITSRVAPPVDLIFDRCKVTSDELTVVLHAHPGLETTRIGLAIRAVPGIDLSARRQISTEISWTAANDDRREGIAIVRLENADNALVMLMVGAATVRRQWLIDPTKARNNRFLAVQHFDADLRKIREAVLESPESRKFEHGVASLLFVLGFSPVVQIETDSPDLIVSTPGGRLIIVECTLRIADVAEKVGKLVDRRGSLEKALAKSGHSSPVLAALVCRLPRDQIAAQDENIKAQKVLLLSNDDLISSLNRVRHPVDPDQLFQTASENLDAS